jgi:hypothetical protein
MNLQEEFKQALKRNDIIAVKKFIDNGHDVNSVDSDGATPLHFTDTKEIAELLISKGANVNAKDNFGNTTLHLSDNPVTVEFLINQGARVNETGFKGYTALHSAAMYGDIEVAKILVANGADVFVINEQFMSPIEVAKSKKHDNLVTYLQNVEDEIKRNLANELLKLPSHTIDKLTERFVENRSDNRIFIGQLLMQQFKSSSPKESTFSIEQKNAIETGNEFFFSVYLVVDENEKDLFNKATLRISHRSDNLTVEELMVFPSTIIPIINLPFQFKPKYIDTWMPVCNQIGSINHFYKSTPREWKNFLFNVQYFSDNWEKYLLI